MVHRSNLINIINAQKQASIKTLSFDRDYRKKVKGSIKRL